MSTTGSRALTLRTRRSLGAVLWVLALAGSAGLGLLAAGCGSHAATSQASARATARPSVAPPPGWRALGTAEFGLALPRSFKGGDLVNDRQVVLNTLRSLGAAFGPYADELEQNPSAFAFLAVDVGRGPARAATVDVVRQQVLAAVTIDAYVQNAFASLPPGFSWVVGTVVQMGPYVAERIVLRGVVTKRAFKELIFVTKVGNTMYTLNFSTTAREFAARLPAFEKSAASFRVYP
jgi:hypothetical protein